MAVTVTKITCHAPGYLSYEEDFEITSNTTIYIYSSSHWSSDTRK